MGEQQAKSWRAIGARMRTGPARLILDPYEWLPADGENAISIRNSDLTLEIDVRYDDPSGTGQLIRTLRFEGAVAYIASIFPGLNLFEFGPTNVELIDKLVEYPESEGAKEWNLRASLPRTIRHFAIPFLSAEVVIHVFAEEAELSATSVSTRN